MAWFILYVVFAVFVGLCFARSMSQGIFEGDALNAGMSLLLGTALAPVIATGWAIGHLFLFIDGLFENYR